LNLTTRFELAAVAGAPGQVRKPVKGTPKDVIGKFNGTAVEALADPSVRPRLVDFGYEIFSREKQTPEPLDALVTNDAKK
jgi:hypothetical protein